MNEELYDDEVHTILDILSDEELYLLEINFIANLQTFLLPFNHPIFFQILNCCCDQKSLYCRRTSDQDPHLSSGLFWVPGMRSLIGRVDHYIFQQDGVMQT